MQLLGTMQRNIQQDTPTTTISYFCQLRVGSARHKLCSCHQAPGLGDLTCEAAAEERPAQLCTVQSKLVTHAQMV